MGQADPPSTACAHLFGETPRGPSSWRVKLAAGGHTWIQEKGDEDGDASGGEVGIQGPLYMCVITSHCHVHRSLRCCQLVARVGSRFCWDWPSTQARPPSARPGADITRSAPGPEWEDTGQVHDVWGLPETTGSSLTRGSWDTAHPSRPLAGCMARPTSGSLLCRLASGWLSWLHPVGGRRGWRTPHIYLPISLFQRSI